MTVFEKAKKIKLFLFGGEFNALNELAQENGGEFNETLEEMEAELEEVHAQKIDNCIVFLRSLEAQIDGAKALEDEIKKNRKSLENKAENFKNYLLFCLDRSQKTELKGNAFKLKPRQGVFSVDIKDQDLIDVKFLTSEVKISADKKVIAESWKRGVPVDGTIWARGKTTLSISSGI